MDELFQSEGVDRRLWQILNTVQRAEPASVADCAQAMAMFVANDTGAVDRLLAQLQERGWATGNADATWTLTDDGRTMLARLTATVAEHRKLMFAGVSDDHYRITVESLARITTNLDPQDASQNLFPQN